MGRFTLSRTGTELALTGGLIVLSPLERLSVGSITSHFVSEGHGVHALTARFVDPSSRVPRFPYSSEPSRDSAIQMPILSLLA